MPYGYRLWIEGATVSPPDRMDRMASVERFVKDVIKAAGMTLAAGPFSYREGNREKGKGPGVTVIAILQESSVHIHTYPEQGWFFFELFSCKHFESPLIEGMVERFFDTIWIRTEFKSIGDDFPDPDPAEEAAK